MMNHIIEAIGKSGIQTTPLTVRARKGPQPGDIVVFPEGAPYPFQEGPGRIEGVGTGMAGPDEAHICCKPCSVFLAGPEHVMIGGGPFACVPVSDLVWTGAVQPASFWNWGNNGPGPRHDVDYLLYRPVWLLRLNKQEG